MEKCRLVQPPTSPEEERREQRRKEWFGQCHDCRHHLEICFVCAQTGQPLKYPISGCPAHKTIWEGRL